MPDTIIASSRSLDFSPAQMWVEDGQSYILAHPRWFTSWNARPPEGHSGFRHICDLDVPANQEQRQRVFESLARWKAEAASNNRTTFRAEARKRAQVALNEAR